MSQWLASDVDVRIIDKPTIGVDVRTKEDMYALIAGRKALGKAVLVIASGLPEIARVFDRIIVMARKTIVWSRLNPGLYDAASEEIMHSVVRRTRSAGRGHQSMSRYFRRVERFSLRLISALDTKNQAVNICLKRGA